MSTLRRARVYRNVELPQQWLGLEPFDALGVITLGWFLMLVNRGAVGLNLLVLVLAYGAVRIGKRGKPEGFTRSLIRHYLRLPIFSGAAPDRQAAARPFPVAAVAGSACSRARTATGAAQSRVPSHSTGGARRAPSLSAAGIPAVASRGSHAKGEPS